MKTVYILRKYEKKQSLGVHLVVNENGNVVYDGHTLELGWHDNIRNKSCVKAGVYDLVLEYSPAFNKKLWEAKGIPNRSECKFHNGVTYKNSKGCFLPGKTRYDLNRDTLDDMINSNDALQEFHDSMGNDTKAKLVIINV